MGAGLWEMTDAAREGHWRGHMSSRGRTRPLSWGRGAEGEEGEEAEELQLPTLPGEMRGGGGGGLGRQVLTWTWLTPLTCHCGHISMSGIYVVQSDRFCPTASAMACSERTHSMFSLWFSFSLFSLALKPTSALKTQSSFSWVYKIPYYTYKSSHNINAMFLCLVCPPSVRVSLCPAPELYFICRSFCLCLSLWASHSHLLCPCVCVCVCKESERSPGPRVCDFNSHQLPAHTWYPSSLPEQMAITFQLWKSSLYKHRQDWDVLVPA